MFQAEDEKKETEAKAKTPAGGRGGGRKRKVDSPAAAESGAKKQKSQVNLNNKFDNEGVSIWPVNSAVTRFFYGCTQIPKMSFKSTILKAILYQDYPQKKGYERR